MFYIYVLRSLRNNKRYVGHTGKSATERLQDHLSGSNKWTRHNGPFKLIHSEPFQTKSEAIKREKFLKSGQGRKWLDENIQG